MLHPVKSLSACSSFEIIFFGGWLHLFSVLQENDIDSQIKELKEITGTDTNVELAMALGTTKNTIQTWRRRGKVPEKVFLKAITLSSTNHGN